jgi:myo-inositol-1-phosphate synthase
MWNDEMNQQVVNKLVHEIKTKSTVPKIGVMLVGLGGNNGSTFCAGILANKKKQSWETKAGIMHANFHGSFTQCATAHVGFKQDPATNSL